jgi:hypothetical protein
MIRACLILEGCFPHSVALSLHFGGMWFQSVPQYHLSFFLMLLGMTALKTAAVLYFTLLYLLSDVAWELHQSKKINK